MLAESLKRETDSLTLSLNGKGPAGTVLAAADGRHRVKGYIENPLADLPAKADGQLDVGGAIGKDGFITVLRDTGGSEPYTGRTQLVSGEVAEDLAKYYLKSEQQPSIVYLCVWVDIDTTVLVAGGLVVSPLPGAEEETLAFVESRIGDIKNYALMLMNMAPGDAVRKIFSGGTIEVLSRSNPAYVCDCSYARFERGILSLGKKEIEDMIREDGQAEVVCRFCNKKYLYNKQSLVKLLYDAK